MARRKRLEMPSAQDLARIEAELDASQEAGQGARRPAPIAQVAAETASLVDPRPPADRVEAARDRADAERLRAAEAEGLLIRELPLTEIDPIAMIRDRSMLIESELDELVISIAAHGLRMPIEVFVLDAPRPGGVRYGLLSGYRRYLAVQRLARSAGQADTATIKALVRDPATLGGAFHAMVAENEIRAALSPYERGRIAVIAAHQGAFVNVEAAVDVLFGGASRAKKSKVRSFALVFEELGQALRFPEQLTERQGLRLSVALRNGAGDRLEAALADHDPAAPDEEWALLEALLTEIEAGPRAVRRGGRPKLPPPAGWADPQTVHLSTGWTLRHERDSQGHLIRITGRELAPGMMEQVLESIRRELEYRG